MTRSLNDSDPLSYDRLIRQYQSPSEREAEGKKRGWASTLETSLLRGEAKLAELKPKAVPSLDSSKTPQSTDWSIEADPISEEKEQDQNSDKKELARDKWNALIGDRFIKGQDDEFDYKIVDGDEGLDDGWNERIREDKWFEDEEDTLEGREGETGIQDF